MYKYIYTYMDVFLQPDPFQTGTGSLMYDMEEV